MRLLYIPFFSNKKNHNGCSIYNTMKVFFRTLVDLDENIFIYFLLPDNLPYNNEKILDHPRIKKIKVPSIGRDQYDEKVLIPSEKLYELFNEDIGKYYYDIVICDKAQITNYLKLVLDRKYLYNSTQSTVYITLTQFITKQEGRFKNITDDTEFSHCIGWLSGFNMFENKRNANICFDIAKKYLQPAYTKKIINSSYLGNVYGLNTKVLDNYYKGNNYKQGDKIKINFANRAASHYKLDEILKVVNYIFKSGLWIKFIITTPNTNIGSYASKIIKEMKKAGLDLELYTGLKQSEFYEKASECHIFISYIDELQSPNSFMEQMYLGQIGLFSKSSWVDYFFPKYPNKFDSFIEVFTLIKSFSKDPKKMIEMNQAYRQKLKENYDIQKNTKTFLSWLNEKIKPEILKTVTENQLYMIKDILEKAGNPKSFTYDEYKKIIRNNTKLKIDLSFPAFGRMNKFDYIKTLYKLGYKDTCEQELKFKKI